MKIFLTLLFNLLIFNVNAQNKLQTNQTIEIDKVEKIQKIRKELKAKKALFPSKNPVYIINGILNTKLMVEDSTQISLIEAVMPKLAIKKYGAKAKNGALLITIVEDRELIYQINAVPENPKDEYVIYQEAQMQIEKMRIERLNDPNIIYEKCEIEPQLKDTSNDFLNKNFKLILKSEDLTQKALVLMKFVVEINGDITQIEVDENSQVKIPSLVAEARRLIIKSNGKWVSGEQNGKKVRSYCKQTITFLIPDEE